MQAHFDDKGGFARRISGICPTPSFFPFQSSDGYYLGHMVPLSLVLFLLPHHLLTMLQCVLSTFPERGPTPFLIYLAGIVSGSGGKITEESMSESRTQGSYSFASSSFSQVCPPQIQFKKVMLIESFLSLFSLLTLYSVEGHVASTVPPSPSQPYTLKVILTHR